MKKLFYILPLVLLLVCCKKESPTEETMLSYGKISIEFMPKKCAAPGGCKQNFSFNALDPGELFTSEYGDLLRMYYKKTGKNTATMWLINSAAGIKYEYSLTFKGKTFGTYDCNLNNSFYASGRFRLYGLHKM